MNHKRQVKGKLGHVVQIRVYRLTLSRLVPSRHLFILAKEYGRGNFKRARALGKEGEKVTHRELTKSFPLITVHTEKRLGTSLLLVGMLMAQTVSGE